MTKKTVNDSEVISVQFCGLNYVKKVSQISLFIFVCLFVCFSDMMQIVQKCFFPFFSYLTL